MFTTLYYVSGPPRSARGEATAHVRLVQFANGVLCAELSCEARRAGVVQTHMGREHSKGFRCVGKH